MKAKYILPFIAGTVLLPSYLCSCGEDRWAAYAEQTQTDRWIDDTMRVWYYWNQDMPTTDEVNYFTAPATFFSSLLNDSDKYSYIDSLHTVQTRSIPYTYHSYGFQFATAKVADNDSALYAALLYVAPDTPADEAGLKRGDWLTAIDGAPITKKNSSRLLGSSAMQIEVAHYDAIAQAFVAEAQPRSLSAARNINDNPVHYSQVLSTSNGHKVGYLVYNHFSSGATTNGTEYNEHLRQVFARFKNEGVDELVLDLRYNNGGLVSCAQLLSTLIAPAEAMGHVLSYEVYNPHVSQEALTRRFDESLIGTGANLNLRRLFVLTSEQTASASELIINCLRPYMDVVVIGEQTTGKNVGSITFTNEALQIEMHPIVCKVYNAKWKSDYYDGFKPDYAVSESSDLSRFLPFGDVNEALLSKAIEVIEGNTSDVSTRTQTAKPLKWIEMSITHRATGSIRIR